MDGSRTDAVSAVHGADSPARGGRSVAVDLLRGVAVTMVMLGHLPFSPSGLMAQGGGGVYPPAAVSNLLAYGHYGVQLFLVISGYCIHTRWARQPDRSAKIDFFAFWRRRLSRLYPPYLVVLALSTALTLAAARFAPESVPPLSARQLVVDLIVLLLLLQNLTDASARVGNPPFWSLALEEQLYLLYFPLLALRRARGWGLALVVSLAVSLVWVALRASVPTSWERGWSLAGPGYWFAWTLGALAAESHLGVVSTPRWSRSWASFAVALIVGMLLPRAVRDLSVTVSFFFLLQATIEFEKNHLRNGAGWFRPLVRLGTISYGVYLIHNIAFVVAKRLLMSMGAPEPVTLVLRGCAGLAAGYIVFRFVERPFLRLSQAIPVPIRGRASAAAR